MIRSFLLKLRHKPKVVRDQVALMFAGGFTFVIFAIWAFTIPSQFSGTQQTQSASLFSGIKDYFGDDIEALDEIVTDVTESVPPTTETTSEDEANLENYLPTQFGQATTVATGSNVSTERTVRIATTSNETATGTQPE